MSWNRLTKTFAFVSVLDAYVVLEIYRRIYNLDSYMFKCNVFNLRTQIIITEQHFFTEAIIDSIFDKAAEKYS